MELVKTYLYINIKEFGGNKMWFHGSLTLAQWMSGALRSLKAWRFKQDQTTGVNLSPVRGEYAFCFDVCMWRLCFLIINNEQMCSVWECNEIYVFVGGATCRPSYNSCNNLWTSQCTSWLFSSHKVHVGPDFIFGTLKANINNNGRCL